MLELWLIRHGETAWNRERRVQGWSDAPLNDLGRAQADRLGTRLAGVTFDAVVSSNATRARETARIALPGREVAEEPRLRELGFGVLEGKTWEEMTAGDRELMQRYRADRFGYRFPEGESGDEQLARVTAWLDEVTAAPAGADRRLVAFSHGGSIRAAVYALVGKPTPRSSWWPRMSNTGITRIAFYGDTVEIITVNDAAHLEDWPED